MIYGNIVESIASPDWSTFIPDISSSIISTILLVLFAILAGNFIRSQFERFKKSISNKKLARRMAEVENKSIITLEKSEQEEEKLKMIISLLNYLLRPDSQIDKNLHPGASSFCGKPSHNPNDRNVNKHINIKNHQNDWAKQIIQMLLDEDLIYMWKLGDNMEPFKNSLSPIHTWRGLDIKKKYRLDESSFVAQDKEAILELLKIVKGRLYQDVKWH